MALPATTSFTGADNDFPAGFTLLTGGTNPGFAYKDNQCMAWTNGSDYSGEGGAYWNGDTFPANQYAQCVAALITGSPSGSAIGLAVRAASGPNYYGFYWNNQGHAYLFRMLAGVWANDFWSPAHPGYITAPTQGQTVKLTIEGVGSVVTAKIYYNGSLQATHEDSSASRIVVAGAAGISGYDYTGGTHHIDDWEAGALAATSPVVSRVARMVGGA